MANKPEQHPLSRYYPTYVECGLAVMLGVVSYFGLFHQQKASAQGLCHSWLLMSRTIRVKLTEKNLQCSTSLSISKATEGGDFGDRNFQENWLKAREQGLHVGAYHFTVYVGMARCRRKIFIATVPKRPMPSPRH